MNQGTLGPNCEVVIPPEIREWLGIGPGDAVAFTSEDGRVVMRKSERSALERLADLGGPMWDGATERLHQDRDEWDL